MAPADCTNAKAPNFQLTQPSASVYFRNFQISLLAAGITIILCTLGFNPATQPIDSIAIIWPGAILHGVGGVLFGGWGVFATVLSGIVVDYINVGTPVATYGYILPNFLQALIPAIYYRRAIAQYGWSPKIFSLGRYLLVGVLAANLVGALCGSIVFHIVLQRDGSFWLPFTRWLLANIPVAALLGWPLLRSLGPTLADEGLTVSGWWR